MILKLLFWNLHNNSNEKWIKELLYEHKIDIAIFSEFQNTKFDYITSERDYIHVKGYGGCEKITMLCKSNILTSIYREQDRYALYVIDGCYKKYILAGIHLPAPPSSDAEARKNVIRDVVLDVCELEKKQGLYNTIVIGDFNCNPFDEEVIQKDSFNAVLFKSLIEKNEFISYQRKRYRRFYNPLIDYISEKSMNYGSVYYSSGSAPLIC